MSLGPAYRGDIYRGERGYTTQRGGAGAIRRRIDRMRFSKTQKERLKRSVPGGSQLMIHGPRRDMGNRRLMMFFDRSAPLRWYKLIRQVRA